ncbi:L-Ala-D/L-Glu epimerase [Lentibacillus sp. JNUCC-1]|uniref:hypothetical protein n=1 Tax=Lentibacillus sp. JNUCC-1 TaxID=2654513 RepID=UPI0012E7DC16|nr:hypothetical protein [Lentibacillus sp. JNUCC-1]MUV37499.1 L-Ala-D/L-Glu epimerase [Lentibacillus sp. JNUCC-1]
MRVKVAVFGRKEIIDKLAQHETDRKSELFPFVYEDAAEVYDLVEKAVMCDVYLFTSPLSYLYAKDKIDKKRLPAVYVPIDEYMILNAFYELKTQNDDTLPRMSIDIDDRKYVDAVVAEQQLDKSGFHVYSYGNDRSIDIDQIVFFHKNLWESDHVDLVLTSSNIVEEKLKQANVPVERIQIPMVNLLNRIEEAKSIALVNQNTSSQMVSGYVRLKHGDGNENENMDKIKDILDEFGDVTSSAVVQSGDAYVIFGTKKLLEYITNNYRHFPLQKELKERVSGEVDIGFGFGLYANQAEHYARLALKSCSKEETGSCFIVNERGETIGPVGVEKKFDTGKLYQALIHKARLNNELSYNFLDFIANRNNEPFSSQDLATYYGVTKRSAERTLGKLINGEVIKAVGEEKPYLRGRPRKLFQINQ